MTEKVDKFDIYGRKDWGSGPWDKEPDRRAWTDKVTGYPCIAKRNRMGAWCGYVGIPKDHPLHGKGYDEVHCKHPDLSVHGGITYAEKCSGDEGAGVCHVPKNKDDEPWWLGFDCIHAGDLAPGYVGLFSAIDKQTWDKLDPLGRLRKSGYRTRDVYRDLPWVEREVANLAKQLKAAT